MVVSIHQPDYIPWLGFYYKVAHSDLFVYLDDAQFSNAAAHNFNVIKTAQGELRLKIPVQQKMGDAILEVKTRDTMPWREKHLKTLEMNYKKAPYFDLFYPMFAEVLSKEYASIAELNMAINAMILQGFGIHVPVLRSSSMGIETLREERILDICSKVGADVYLSGNGARVYQEEAHFSDRGIVLQYLDYQPIAYPQVWPRVGFLPCMSVIDYIFNCGFDWAYVEEQVQKRNASAGDRT